MLKNHKYFLLAGLIILLAIALRVANLMRFPIFADEAIYASWSLAIGQSIENINLPILDGKPPLYMLMYAKLFDLTHLPPMLLARLISVVSGVLVVITVFPLSKLMKLKPGMRLVAGFFAAISFYLVYLSRLGLLDSLLTLFTTLTFITFLLALTQKHKYTYLFTVVSGVTLGISLWTKTSAVFLVPPVLFLGAYYSYQEKNIKTLLKSLVVVLVGAAIFLVLAKLSVFPSLFSRSQDFTFTLIEVITKEYLFSLNNYYLFTTWLGHYTGWISLFLVAIAVIKSKTGPVRPMAIALLLLVLPLLTFGKVLSPRYLLPALPIWLVLATAGLAQLKNAKLLQTLIVAVIAIQMMSLNLTLIINPDKTNFVTRDISEYLTSWSSGHGVYEIADYLTQVASQSGRVSVATEGFYGPVPTGLQLTLYDHKQIDVYGIGHPVYSLPDRTLKEAETIPTFLVVNRDRLMNEIPGIELIAEYPRPHKGESLLLFRVTEKNE